LDIAGSGPRPSYVEISIPLQRPQLFEPDLSRRAIHKGNVYPSFVPVDAKAQHFIVLTRTGYYRRIIIFGRWIKVLWMAVPDTAIPDHRYTACISSTGRPPEISNRASIVTSRIFGRIKKIGIQAVAAYKRWIIVSPGSEFAATAGSVRHNLGPRADAHLCVLVVFPQHIFAVVTPAPGFPVIHKAIAFACFLTRFIAGINIAISSAIMAITTRSSINVNALVLPIWMSFSVFALSCLLQLRRDVTSVRHMLPLIFS
jgi:hypothetical protein